jgi:hypothetical protein
LFNQIDTIPEIYHGIDKLEASELLEIANQYFSEENFNELIFDLADN